jgi:NitT/TauT family transport system permease protein
MNEILGYRVQPDPKTVISTADLPYYVGRTLGRMTAAYFLSLAFAIVYGIATAMTRRASHVLLPLLDILQSVPVVAFIPVVFIFFIRSFGDNGAEVSSIILIFAAMVWAPTFGVISGINQIPHDIKEAAKAYGIKRLQYVRQIVLPAVFPELVWGSVLAWGGGWYVLPLEEYLSFGRTTNILPGIGSYIYSAAAASKISVSLFGLAVLVAIIFAIDRLVWKPLSIRAEKYKYESTAAPSSMHHRARALLAVRRYEEKLVSPILSFFRAERQYFRSIVDFTHLRSRLHFSDRVRFPGRLRLAVFGRIVSFVIFFLLIGIGVPFLLNATALPVGQALALLGQSVNAVDLVAYTLFSVSRIFAAYLIALAWTIGAGILIARSKRLSRALIPIFDIGQSIPATALFPIILLVFVEPFAVGSLMRFVVLNLASIILLLAGMQWYILFNIVGGVNNIPNDILEASAAYRIRGRAFIRQILVPASYPAILIGSIQAWGGGWNATIVSEYISDNSQVPGLGSFLVRANNLTDTTLGAVEIAAAIMIMTLTVVLINRLVWRRLLRKADKYKFET